MFKTFTTAAMVGAVSAIKLRAEIESEIELESGCPVPSLTKFTQFHNSADYLNGIIAKNVPWTDPVFPPNNCSLGGSVADTANTTSGSSSAQKTWKRLGDVYGADARMFAWRETYSTIEQGSIGDCYYISTLAAFDTRPGALEHLFITTQINKAGAYGMKLYIDGIERFVAVDDYIPMSKGWVQALDGSWHDSWVPVYAKSRIYGEIWPEIAEKVWAKVYGSYAAMGNGGLNSQVINHLTQNPTEIISIHEKGYTTDNAKGKWLWNAMLDWTKRDYLIFLGTGSFSWVHGHAYTIIGAYDLTINGTKQQWIRVRNPWGKTDWTAETSQDPTAYKKNHPEVIKLIGKEMPGTFDFTFDDLLHQVENVSVDLGQYSKNGTAVAPQYTKVLEVPHADSATDNKTFKVAIKTWKNLNLEDFWLAIDTIQGGNRIGTLADKNLQGISGWFYYSLYSNTNSYSSQWDGWGVAPGIGWDMGNNGNHHVISKAFDESATASTPGQMAAGTYILEVTPHWKPFAESHPIVKQLTMRFTSEVPLQAEMVKSDGQWNSMWSHVPATVMPNYSKWIADANNAKAPVFSEAYYAQKYHMAKAAVVNKKFQDTYKNAAGHAFNPYGQYSYKFSALTFSNSSGFAGRYMCEIDKNDTSHPLTVTYKFISSWTVLTPYTTNNEFTVTLQPGEQIIYGAQANSESDTFSWNIYSMHIHA